MALNLPARLTAVVLPWLWLPGCGAGGPSPPDADADAEGTAEVVDVWDADRWDAADDLEPDRPDTQPDDGGGTDDGSESGAPLSTLVCEMGEPVHEDVAVPATVSGDFGPPRLLPDSINTWCYQDAIEVSPDGRRIYHWYAVNHFQEVLLPAGRQVSGTEIRFQDQLPDGRWDAPRVLDLRSGGGDPECAEPCSLPGETRVARDASWVIWHAQSPNTVGVVEGLPPGQDFDLDLYEAPIVDDVPGPGAALAALNTRFLEGEHWATEDGRVLYFASNRPGGTGASADPLATDIWRVERDAAGAWGAAEPLTAPVNSDSNELMPTVSPDGEWFYFVTTRRGGGEIWRARILPGGGFGEAEPVVGGNVGEPSFAGDGRLFFVHAEVWFDGAGYHVMDTDVFCVERSGDGRPCTEPR